MTTRKRALTAQIKPATRNAIMDQLAAAADGIILTNQALQTAVEQLGELASELAAQKVRSGNALAYAIRQVEFLQARAARNQKWLGLWLIAAGVTGIIWLVTI